MKKKRLLEEVVRSYHCELIVCNMCVSIEKEEEEEKIEENIRLLNLTCAFRS